MCEIGLRTSDGARFGALVSTYRHYSYRGVCGLAGGVGLMWACAYKIVCKQLDADFDAALEIERTGTTLRPTTPVKKEFAFVARIYRKYDDRLFTSQGCVKTEQ